LLPKRQHQLAIPIAPMKKLWIIGYYENASLKKVSGFKRILSIRFSSPHILLL
jgi:hypothetical protein